jgi:hypothetical protein
VTQDLAGILSGLAHALSLVLIDVLCECYYSGLRGLFLLFFFFFGFSFLIQRPLSCSPTAARLFALLEQQGAARHGTFLARLASCLRSPALADLAAYLDLKYVPLGRVLSISKSKTISSFTVFMNTASKLGPQTQSDRGAFPGVGSVFTIKPLHYKRII